MSSWRIVECTAVALAITLAGCVMGNPSFLPDEDEGEDKGEGTDARVDTGEESGSSEGTAGDTTSSETTDTEPDGGTCADLIFCIDACADNPACAEACFAMANQLALGRYDELIACYELHQVQTLLDIAQWCAEPTAQCTSLTTGDASCEDILDCQLMCPDDSCAHACFIEGTWDDQVAFVRLAFCYDYYCPGNDPACLADVIAPGGYCFEYAVGCGLE